MISHLGTVERIIQSMPDDAGVPLKVDAHQAECEMLQKEYGGGRNGVDISILPRGYSVDGTVLGLTAIQLAGIKVKKWVYMPEDDPDEPFGKSGNVRFRRYLCENPSIMEELDCGFLFMDLDPDGSRLNEGWFDSGSMTNYLLYSSRPARSERRGWGYPFRYKTASFDRSLALPETEASMQAMEQYRPSFVFPQDNANLQGASFLVSRDDIPQPFIADLQLLAQAKGQKLHEGIVDSSPYFRKLASGIYKIAFSNDLYEWLAAEYPDKDPGEIMTQGAHSSEFIRDTVGRHALTVVPEASYFTGDIITDESPAGISRRAATIEGSRRRQEAYRLITEHMAAIDSSKSSRYPALVRSIIFHKQRLQTQFEHDRAILANPAFGHEEITHAGRFALTVYPEFYAKKALGYAHSLADITGNARTARQIRRVIEPFAYYMENEEKVRPTNPRNVAAINLGAALLTLYHLQG